MGKGSSSSSSNRRALGLVLWMAICVNGEHKAAEDDTTNLKDIKEKSKSWDNWPASDKFSDGVGRFMQETEAKESQDAVETYGEAASTAMETLNSVGSGTSKYAWSKAARKLSEAKEFGLDKAKDAYDEFKRRINLAKNEALSSDDDDDEDDSKGVVGERIDVGRDNNQIHDHRSESKGHKVIGGTKDEKDKADENYKEAKAKEQELKVLAGETETEDIKRNYEGAKENVSVELGATLRDQSGEL